MHLYVSGLQGEPWLARGRVPIDVGEAARVREQVPGGWGASVFFVRFISDFSLFLFLRLLTYYYMIYLKCVRLYILCCMFVSSCLV